MAVWGAIFGSLLWCSVVRTFFLGNLYERRSRSHCDRGRETVLYVEVEHMNDGCLTFCKVWVNVPFTFFDYAHDMEFLLFFLLFLLFVLYNYSYMPSVPLSNFSPYSLTAEFGIFFFSPPCILLLRCRRHHRLRSSLPHTPIFCPTSLPSPRRQIATHALRLLLLLHCNYIVSQKASIVKAKAPSHPLF